jgi:superfamily I DNA/RNA helicase
MSLQFIEGGAGTGKTTTVITRLVSLSRRRRSAHISACSR